MAEGVATIVFADVTVRSADPVDTPDGTILREAVVVFVDVFDSVEL